MTSTTQLTPLRYDSPTVTLEVMAREAAVSQWSDKPVVQVLRYQLQIRSLSGAGAPMTIQGDRASFLPLVEAVQDYLQTQLTGTELESGDRSPLTPYLIPNGLTQHTLYLGGLHTTTGDSTVALGALQLADLSDILDQLTTQVRPLPIALTPTPKQRPWQQWGAAAAGIVAAVGVTTALWPNYQSPTGMGETALEAPTVEPAPSAAAPEAALEESAPRPETTPNPQGATAPEAIAPPATQNSAERQVPAPSTAAPETAPQTDAAKRPVTSPSNQVAPQSPPVAPVPEVAPAPAPAPEPAPDAAARSPGPAGGAARPPRSPAAAPADDTQLADQAAEDQGASAAEAPESFTTLDSEALTQRAAPTEIPESLAALVETVRDRWTPPDALNQNLTYTLVFAADGTLSEIIPADDRSAQYQDLAGLPEVGTEWLPAGNPQRVQLLLKPNGAVELLEVAPEP